MNYSNAKAENLELREHSDLEFPDWSGMKPHPSRMSFEQAVLWNEEMLALFAPSEKSRRAPQARCMVDFTL